MLPGQQTSDVTVVITCFNYGRFLNEAMRSALKQEGGPPRIINVYLDPPTARVLDVVDFRPSLIGWLHRFHENLTIPEYSGRAIVGWVGVGMLLLSLTGIWLWWPRNGAFLPGLRWRRAAHATTNEPIDRRARKRRKDN